MDAVIEILKEMNIGNVIVSLGGTIIVAFVSLRSIRESNRNALELKKSDYRRTELSDAADAIEASRAMIERIANATDLLQKSVSSQEYSDRSEAESEFQRLCSEVQSERGRMERILLRVIITNPERLVRDSARITDGALAACVERDLEAAATQKGGQESIGRLRRGLTVAKECFGVFRSCVYKTYHNEVPSGRSIRKSDMSENDLKIKAARAALTKHEKEESTNGGADDGQPA